MCGFKYVREKEESWNFILIKSRMNIIVSCMAKLSNQLNLHQFLIQLSKLSQTLIFILPDLFSSFSLNCLHETQHSDIVKYNSR